MSNKDQPEASVPVKVQKAIRDHKLITAEPIETKSIEIPIIPPRDHVEEEVDVKVVRIRKPVQINFMRIEMMDGGGYMVSMPGGEVQYFGAQQSIFVASMEELVQLVARCLGQTTYEYVEMSDYEWERYKEEQY